MKYSNETVRRQDRLLDENAATELLKNGKYGVLSMWAEQGGAYGLPMSYAWDGKDTIYMHCALEGRKLKCIEACNDVSFCVIGEENVIPEKFTTEYESIILECLASTGLDNDEKMKALILLVEKYSPGLKEKGTKYAKNALHETEIIKLMIKSWSGKCKK